MKNPSFKNILLFFLIILLGYSVSQALFSIMAERTLGSIFRNSLPGIFYLFLILIVNTSNITAIHLSDVFQRLPQNIINININIIFRRLLFIVPLALICGLLTFRVSDMGLLYVPLGLVIIGAYFYSCYCCLERKYLHGILIFIISQPFLSLYEWDFVEFFFDNWSFRTIFWIPYSPTNIFLYSIFSIWLINHLLERRPFISSKLYFFILLFFATVLLSLVINVRPLKPDFIGFLSVSIIPGLFFFMLVHVIKGWDDILSVFKVTFVSILLYAFYGFYFFSQKAGLAFLSIPVKTYGDIYEMATGPGGRAILLAIGMPLGIVLAITARERIKSYVYILFDMVAFLMLILTEARGAIAACIISIAVFSNLKRLVYFAFFIGCSYIVFTPLFFSFAERFQNIHSIQDIKLRNFSYYRHLGWKAAEDMIKDHPFTGVGYNQYEKAWFSYGYGILPDYREGKLVDWNMGNTHNLYYEVASNSGLIGLFALLALLAYIGYLAINPLRKKLDTIQRNIHIGLLSSFIAIFLISFFGSIFFLPDPFLNSNLLFYELLALLVVVNKITEQSANNGI